MAVFKKRMRGRANACQSSEAPWRTTSALVSAANVMAIAQMATQMPVCDGSIFLTAEAGRL
jgi:hypothetical protein